MRSFLSPVFTGMLYLRVSRQRYLYNCRHLSQSPPALIVSPIASTKLRGRFAAIQRQNGTVSCAVTNKPVARRFCNGTAFTKHLDRRLARQQNSPPDAAFGSEPENFLKRQRECRLRSIPKLPGHRCRHCHRNGSRHPFRVCIGDHSRRPGRLCTTCQVIRKIGAERGDSHRAAVSHRALPAKGIRGT